MEFQLKKNNNKNVTKTAKDFMDTNDNDVASKEILLNEIERQKIKTKGQLIKFAKKNGFLKTDKDRRVLNTVLRISKLPENNVYDRAQDERINGDREMVNKILGYKAYAD